jgi:glycosyltransferase involved in cell wall biosynthesis
MREVLFIAYYFPPLGGSGVIRPLKFAKYLPQYGWKPTILTVSKGDSFVFDDTLLSELSDQVTVERVEAVQLLKTSQAKNIAERLKPAKQGESITRLLRSSLARLLRALYFSVFIPDDKVGWLVPAVRKASQLKQRHNFEIIFATSPPQTNLLVATQVKRRLKIPVIIDYRDEWTTDPHKREPNFITKWLNRYLEKRVINNSDAITVMSKGVLNNLYEAKLVTKTNKIICKILPNGFDPADFNVTTSALLTEKFKIVYTGSFYGELRVPDPFLHALHVWLRIAPEVRNDLQVLFQGSIYPQHQNLRNELQLNDILQISDPVPYHQAVATQQLASILLLIMGKGEGTAILPGKVFEYLGAKRPILAIVHPEGEAAALIKRTNTGVVVDPDDTHAIVKALQDFYTEWRTGEISYSPVDDEVKLYSRREQARQLCDLFEQI